jgi:hypothetical protein
MQAQTPPPSESSALPPPPIGGRITVAGRQLFVYRSVKVARRRHPPGRGGDGTRLP